MLKKVQVPIWIKSSTVQKKLDSIDVKTNASTNKCASLTQLKKKQD